MTRPFACVFTPTHDARWLRDAYASLVAQTAEYGWCWSIVRDGVVDIPAEIAADPRVAIADAPPGASGVIGALKRAACGAACEAAKALPTDLLVELDHDDMLAPTAIRDLQDAALGAGGGFLYSDWAGFYPDGSEACFHGHGWESYAAAVAGRPYRFNRAFPPTPRSLSAISYGPNHVRAWTRAAYDLAGGHDPSMSICDDMDLICRTYLAGVPFTHVPRPLYLYRERPPAGDEPQNTYRARSDAIAAVGQEVSNRHTFPMVAEWCRRSGLRMLDFGDRDDCPDGYESMPIPEWSRGTGGRGAYTPAAWIDPDSVGSIRAVDVLPYLDREDVPPFWNWAHRVLAADGWLHASTMSTDGRGAFQDPAFRSYWNSNSFWAVTSAKHQRGVPGLEARFQLARGWDSYPSDWHKAHGIAYCHADLACLKGQRVPGPCYI